jgi:hypothetical protein
MASADHRERVQRGAGEGAVSTPSWPKVIVIGLALWLGIFLLYFLAYPIRDLTLPVGFDPPWYVWRAEHFTSQGIGNGGLAARPGYPVLSALLGTLTGLSQLEMTVVLSLVLVSLLALAVGAFAREGLGFSGWRWALVVATTGIVLGPTHLVGENLSNALNIAMEIAAMVGLAAFIGGGRGLVAAVALLVAGGVAHWDFVALFAVVMGVAFLTALPSSRRERDQGVPLVRTESSALAVVGAWAGGILLVLVAAVLRAPFRTIEIGNDELLFRRKFRTDVARLFVPGVAGLVGPWAFSPDPGDSDGQERRRQAFAVRLLKSWTYVMAAGMVVGIFTSALPPARFLAHLVALPGAIAVAAAVAAVARWVAKRKPPIGSPRVGARVGVSVVVIVVVLGALAIPGLIRWYRYPVLLEPTAVQQARTADRYVRTLAPGRPVVFLMDYRGRPGSLSAVLKERTIRMGLSPDRQLDAHVYVGELSDLLVGRRTPAPDERAERFTRRYWEDVRPLLADEPPVVILRAMTPDGYREAVAMGAAEVAPNVAVLRGPAAAAPFSAASTPDEVPSLPAGILWGLAVLALLSAAGVGWTRVLLGPGRAAETVVSMTPVVGAGILILGGLAAALMGVRLGGVSGAAIYVVVVLSGVAAALLDVRERRPTG